MAVRAIRGATTAENTREDIFFATKEMVSEIISKNGIQAEDMIDIIFTMTKDLDAAFPAAAVRDLGIVDVPLLDFQELYVKGALKNCIRVMIHINTDKENAQMKHVYLRDAKVLRPDLIEK